MNLLPPISFNIDSEIIFICHPKFMYQELMVRNFGEDFYYIILVSPIPFIISFIIHRYSIIVLTLYQITTIYSQEPCTFLDIFTNISTLLYGNLIK